MKKLTSTLPNMMLSLGTITIIAGALLGVIYMVTKEPIAVQEQDCQIQAIRDVTPPFDNNPEADKWSYRGADGIECTVYPATEHGKLVGAAVKSESNNGFAGLITTMTGFNLDGSVRDYRVLQQAETPGLGAKMEAWFRDPTAARSIIGKNPATQPFYVTKDKEKGGTVDAITAATISSRAFLESVRDAYDAYKQYSEQKGGNK